MWLQSRGLLSDCEIFVTLCLTFEALMVIALSGLMTIGSGEAEIQEWQMTAQ